jgi:hypothetical protein
MKGIRAGSQFWRIAIISATCLVGSHGICETEASNGWEALRDGSKWIQLGLTGDKLVIELSPTPGEREQFSIAGEGWLRWLPVSGGSGLAVIINHCTFRKGIVYIRGKIAGSPASLLVLTIRNQSLRGFITAPGLGNFSIGEDKETIYLSRHTGGQDRPPGRV